MTVDVVCWLLLEDSLRGISERCIEEKSGIRVRLPKGVRHSRGDGRLEGDLGNLGNAKLGLSREVQSHRGLS